MPSLKVKVNPEAKSAFESYDGPDVPVGNGYEGVIKSVRVKQSKGNDSNPNGNPYLNVLVEHSSKDPVKKQYNGAPQWIRVMFGEHDETQARLAAFIKAVTGKANKEANIVDTDEDARAGTGSIVKTIDGVKPEGKRVKFDVRMEAAQNGYPARTTADFIRRAIDAPSAPVEEDEIDEDDIEVEGDDEDVTREDREKELKGLPIKELREAAKTAEIDTAGLKKSDLIQAILDWEYEDEEDADEDAEEEDDVDVEEDDIEGDEDDEEEDEDGEDGEEEEDEGDPESELRAELADLDRSALKARLKAADADFKVLKKHSDDDLRDAVVSAELSEAPF